MNDIQEIIFCLTPVRIVDIDEMYHQLLFTLQMINFVV